MFGFRHLAGHELMKSFEDRFGFDAALSLDRRRHERRRRFRDGAALALEADVAHRLAVHLHPERQRIAAEGIAALDRSISVDHLPEIARLPVVLEDDFLIEGVGVAHTNRSSDMRSRFSRISLTSIVS